MALLEYVSLRYNVRPISFNLMRVKRMIRTCREDIPHCVMDVSRGRNRAEAKVPTHC
jgi:hypothetical protein